MANSLQQTLFALDCGATNWRLYRLEYKANDASIILVGEPQPASLTSFVDRKLPAVICLNPAGTALESWGDGAQQQLEDEKNRERVREYFKPCIGAHLESAPLPHQKRYTHAQAMQFTEMLLRATLDQLCQDKWRCEAFDDRVRFTFAYPVHWRYDHDGKVFEEFEQVVRGCFKEPAPQIRFVSEPEGAILCLQHRGLVTTGREGAVTLIVDVGGSTTDIVAGRVDSQTGELHYIGRYGEPFGGGLYDAELAKFIIDELNIPPSAFTDDPSALVTLRIFGQRLKESLSRQLSQKNRSDPISQRTLTLVMRDGTVYRRVIALDEAKFKKIVENLDQVFRNLIESALKTISLKEGDIDQVVLVGGGAQLFTLTEYLRQRFGRDKVLLADNAEEIVVQGIGLEYGASFGKHEPTIQFAAETPKPEPESQPAAYQNDTGLSLTCEDGRTFPFFKEVLTAGRGETNDICLDDLKVSRFHSEFRVRDQKVEIIDLGSTNGTFVNGQKLTPHQPCLLNLEDEVTVGKTKFRIKQ